MTENEKIKAINSICPFSSYHKKCDCVGHKNNCELYPVFDCFIDEYESKIEKLTEHNKHLEEQIGKMKCCFNCSKRIMGFNCTEKCYKFNKWELVQ